MEVKRSGAGADVPLMGVGLVVGRSIRARPGLAVWVAALGMPAAAILVLGQVSTTTWVAPGVLFGGVGSAAFLCLVAALCVMDRGRRSNLAEVGLLGAALGSESVLSLAHALDSPGIIHGPNAAVGLAAFLAVPAALVTCAPLVVPESSAGRWIGRRWRGWATGCLGMAAVLSTVLVVAPGAVPSPPSSGSPVTAVVVFGGLVAAGRVSWRHLRMYRIGRRPASLVSSAAVGVLGLVPLVFLGGTEFGVAWWLAHGVDIVAVFIACVGIAIAYRADRSLLDVLAPVVVRDPLAALELGLAPEVRAFVAAIGRKDELTRAHVVRVAELTMRVGERAGLAPERLRALGLGGLLHDLGKLVVPDAVLQKPGELDADERAVIQTHTIAGADMLERASEALRPVAPLVRWHHERHDGTGYPDGLADDRISLEVGIISVCDAWDAMTTLRHYRTGLSPLQAATILREGAGTQWSARCVELTLAEIAASGPVAEPSVLTDLGRSESSMCACPDALPEALSA